MKLYCDVQGSLDVCRICLRPGIETVWNLQRGRSPHVPAYQNEFCEGGVPDTSQKEGINCGDTSPSEYWAKFWPERFQCGIGSFEGHILSGRPVKVPNSWPYPAGKAFWGISGCICLKDLFCTIYVIVWTCCKSSLGSKNPYSVPEVLRGPLLWGEFWTSWSWLWNFSVKDLFTLLVLNVDPWLGSWNKTGVRVIEV
jgi:hypothetical protein